MKSKKNLLDKVNKINEKENSKPIKVSKLKKRIKNSKIFTNIKSINDDGLLNLKTGEVATIMQIHPVDLSLSGNDEKKSFFFYLNALYKIPHICFKFYKLDEKIDLEQNKKIMDERIEKYKHDKNRLTLLESNKALIECIEEEHLTTSSKYYLVVISKNIDSLNKTIDDIEIATMNIMPKLYIDSIVDRLEIYKILTNIYLSTVDEDTLKWCDLPSLLAPMNISEKVDKFIIDSEDVQLLTIKDISNAVDEMFFERLFNFPGIRVCLNVRDICTQEELIRWVNSKYQFLLADRKTTRKLSDATEFDTETQNFQSLMNDIKNGDERVVETTLILVIQGDKKYREDLIRNLKSIGNEYKVKLDVPRMRQQEAWDCYDIKNVSFNDYSFYLPTYTLTVGFPFTEINHNDPAGLLLGYDNHTNLPIFFDNFLKTATRPSYNMAIVASTGGGKSFTIKKMIVNHYVRGTKTFIFDAEGEYKDLVLRNGGEYIDLYSKSGGIINPLQIRYIPTDDPNEDSKETDCPLAKHLSYLESFFKTAFEDIKDVEVIELTHILESLYSKFGILQSTTINILDAMKPEQYPTMNDLNNFIPEYKKGVVNKEEIKIIEGLEVLISRFVGGIDNALFNGYTNIDLSNDLIGFNLQELLLANNKRIKNTQILNLLSYLNNTIVGNKIVNDRQNEKKHVMIIADEFHVFIDKENPEVLRSFGQLARRVRKYNGSLVVATQSIKDFIGKEEIAQQASAIFNNCQYQMVGMLKEDDLKAYLSLFTENPLTETQKNFLLVATQGQFLLNIDAKERLVVKVEATPLEREMMGEN